MTIDFKKVWLDGKWYWSHNPANPEDERQYTEIDGIWYQVFGNIIMRVYEVDHENS